ncbi:hypothetical protein HUG15_11770 [Salicibibacter cibarius]|uniref:Uncharacterized protein n=1 Tax=Salicibibacter cibarius TaxID=2743000 RepID=A0A7T6Z374_9BACI|nr:hypothetical protein HUG15_11770 [Salicibibacter cibarius]
MLLESLHEISDAMAGENLQKEVDCASISWAEFRKTKAGLIIFIYATGHDG